MQDVECYWHEWDDEAQPYVRNGESEDADEDDAFPIEEWGAVRYSLRFVPEPGPALLIEQLSKVVDRRHAAAPTDPLQRLARRHPRDATLTRAGVLLLSRRGSLRPRLGSWH